MKILFYVSNLYYIPQFLPVYEALLIKKHHCELVVLKQDEENQVLQQITNSGSFKMMLVDSEESAIEHFQQQRPDWIIFGNSFRLLKELPSSTLTALMYHGIGVKDCYYDEALSHMDVRFVEGKHRQDELQKRFPKANSIAVGFAKLDPIFSHQIPNEDADLSSINLSINKKTILYAPTFYPSSIENFPDDFPERFSEYNIIIKPHQFSLTKQKYSAHRRKLSHWKTYQNVYLVPVEELNILPYFYRADILVSDASSVLFEFAALNKPVIWCDFVKLRWSYRGIFNYRYRKRMDQSITKYFDIARHVSNYQNLKQDIEHQLQNPSEFEPKRLKYTKEIIGLTDGQASNRIVNYLIHNSH